jgi:hypothetical protein
MGLRHSEQSTAGRAIKRLCWLASLLSLWYTFEDVDRPIEWSLFAIRSLDPFSLKVIWCDLPAHP